MVLPNSRSVEMNIYQVLPRLYGNRSTTNKPHGTIQENGCGKLAWFRQKDLIALRRQGYTHIWFTGLLEHATKTTYSNMPTDHPDVVKGQAGSPYAIRDYYDIDPDLAVNVDARMEEFEALVHRVHRAGLKFIMDFVPNHVARQYHSDAAPEGVVALGADDDTSVHFSPDNNFYYVPGETLHFGSYEETPARATGNDVFHAYPGVNDWYETCKLNYGGMAPSSSTWRKMTEILLFWASKGVDAFRCDMAEMVPVAFWEHAIRTVKESHPEVIFIAEVYNPNLYRSYIRQGGFDYLYDKVGLYDTLRNIIVHHDNTHNITKAWQSVDDIRAHMLYFMENHDEQRIASDFFAGDARKGRPAMAVEALIGANPLMVYAGQELGEKGMDEEGFSGCDGRTSIFDYWSPLSLRKLSGHETLTPDDMALQQWYSDLLKLRTKDCTFLQGPFFDLMYANSHISRQYAFIRGENRMAYLVVANFDDTPVEIEVNIPSHARDFLNIHCEDKQTVKVDAYDYTIVSIK